MLVSLMPFLAQKITRWRTVYLQYVWSHGFPRMEKGKLVTFVPLITHQSLWIVGSPWPKNFMQCLWSPMGKEGAQIRGGLRGGRYESASSRRHCTSLVLLRLRYCLYGVGHFLTGCTMVAVYIPSFTVPLSFPLGHGATHA